MMPVWKACAILGKPTVSALVQKLLLLRADDYQDVDLHQELLLLVNALCYNPLLSEKNADVPLEIVQACKRWTSLKQLSLDKYSALQFLVPPIVQPQPGPSGHQGLFDCIVYAIQNHLLTSGSSYQNHHDKVAAGVILVPDVLILLAICKDYYDSRELGKVTDMTENIKEEEREEDKACVKDNNLESTSILDRTESSPKKDNENAASSTISLMARLAYRIYDAYQKKGSVSRDTVHRFLTDIYGENSYKQPRAEALLDIIFDDSEHAAGWLGANVGEDKFCRRVLETMDPKRPYILLDWLATLVCHMIPPAETPESIQAYMETRNRKPVPLCDAYALAENRLFEIKRKFHSMVQTSTPVIQGDPMESVDANEEQQQPKSAITKKSFVAAVSKENVDMGHGGYLPESIAELVFRVGCHVQNNSQTDESKSVWTLYHVLKFGCTAVRLNTTAPEDRDLPLLRLLFGMFQLTGNDDMEDVDRTVLTRVQIARMVLLLVEYLDYRAKADAAVDMDESVKTKEYRVELHDNVEESLVEAEAAKLLGLVPPGSKKGEESLSLESIVDYIMKDCLAQDQMVFDEFYLWKMKKAKSFVGLNCLVTELRLVASVMLGVPPSEASMEGMIIGELEARHKARFPQTEVSRRGPRGTLWYLIDSGWLKNWASLMTEVANTVDDPKDGRGDPVAERVRGLKRINNRRLLIEGGGLELRSDIQWKHDYEILPPLAWSALHAWYDGGPQIHRSVVKYLPGSAPHRNQTRYPTENELELYPFFVTVFLCDAPSRGEARPFQQNYQVSRVSPVFIIHLQLCRELEVDPNRARLWYLENDPESQAPPNTSTKVESREKLRGDWILEGELNILEQRKRRGRHNNDATRGIRLLLELKDDETGFWPRGIDGRDWLFKEKSIHGRNTDLGDGIVGLYNMGNSCYMNATIQCLSHTPIFREYFTSQAYLRDINTKNPLGFEGKLAHVTAVLINSIWKRMNQSAPHQPKRVSAPGSYALINAPSLTPKTFKESLGKFKEEFAGNEQHDAEELMNFLLDKLNEDLNRVIEKPYTEQPDSDGRPDSEVADIWWENHLKRELSIIVALFTGQYKSLLTCRQCKYESARFEPYSLLQVPLPEDDHHYITMVVYPRKENVPIMRYSARVRADGRLRDVLIALSKLLLADEIATKNDTAAGATDGPSDTEIIARAQDLAIVDLRDGCIVKIAPNSWLLLDLQNKETGELPVFQVYELDPLRGASLEYMQSQIASSKSPQKQLRPDSGQMDSEIIKPMPAEDVKPKYGFLTVAQRRPEVCSQEFLHPFSQRVFGTPMLLRVDNLDDRTGSDLYDLVAKRLRTYVPKAAQKFLFDSTLRTDNGTTSLPGPHRTLPDAEDVAGGPVPRYGFRLRLTSRDGRQCCNCQWYECCIGCTIPDNSEKGIVMDSDSLVVDWHFAVDMATLGFGMRSSPLDPISRQPASMKQKPKHIKILNHHSVGVGSKNPGPSGSITLGDCLDAFAKEERISDTYCSKCKDLRVQTKHMSFWKVPPILIIQFKRFQHTPTMHRKLRDHVVFPVEGLDLSRFMSPQIKRQGNGLESSAAVSNLQGNDQESPTVTGDDLDSEFAAPAETTPAISPPLIDSASDLNKDDSLYDLYGVVHHQGAMSTGHYVASIKSELDGHWRLFNDAQIYEIHARDVVDSSAYILFYVRRDVIKGKTLSDFWNVRAEGEGITEDDLQNLLKGAAKVGEKSCTIS
ncbi:hypothetical protein MPSEU_000165400 [Mayamaea pseudoterrestris]|nr:hypothetical protein MPSEU_000165400 [Mayamaea pseudoterrestris]